MCDLAVKFLKKKKKMLNSSCDENGAHMFTLNYFKSREIKSPLKIDAACFVFCSFQA